MPITNPLTDVPRAPKPSTNSPLPRGATVLAHDLADRWWTAYQASPEFQRDRAMPELPLRASLMGIRCDRQLWYILTDTPESNPAGAANVWRMRMGTLIHNEIANTIAASELDGDGNRHGWWDEASIDLRPAGYPGSAHGDLIYFEHGEPQIVAEVKSIGGFGYKMAATSYKGQPEGAKFEHVLQAAIVAVAVGAPKIAVLYVSPECISPSEAERAGLDESGKFVAEWQFDTKDWVEAVEVEIARQQRVLDLATPNADGTMWMPIREMHHPDMPEGAMIDNPATGHWIVVDAARPDKIARSGKDWRCGYCSFRDQCLEDGEDMQPVRVSVKP